MITDAFEFVAPIKLAGGDRQIYHQTIQNITSYDSGVDTTINTGKATGDIYCVTIVGDTRLVWVDASLSGDKFVKVPRLDYREVALRWTLQGLTAGDVPFTVGSNSVGVMVTGLNAEKCGGFLTAQALTNSTIAVRDAGGRVKVATPAADDDACPRSYVDTVAAGFKGKADRKCAFTGNWSATRSGNVLTATANGSINSSGLTDGVTLANGDLVLIPFQTTQADRGFYTATDIGSAGTPAIFTRSTDADTDAEMTTGVSCVINEGTLYGNNTFALATQGTIVLNTTALTFVITAKPGNFTAGKGMVKVGTTFHAVTSSDYTTGGIVWANATTTLTMTAALSGLLYGDGANGPKVVTGLASNKVPKYSASGPYLLDSCLTDNGSKLTVSLGVEPTVTTLLMGSATLPWAETHTKDVRTSKATGAGLVEHWRVQNGTGLRWAIGITGNETAGTNGSDLYISRHDNAGAFLDIPFSISRATGRVLMNLGTGVSLAGDINLEEFTSGSIPFIDSSANLAQANADLFYSTGRVRVGWSTDVVATASAGHSAFGRNVSPHATTDTFLIDRTHATRGAQSVVMTDDSIQFHVKLGSVTAGGSAASQVAMLKSVSGGLTGLSVGTTGLRGELDLGSALLGRSITWGGPAGDAHYVTIGAAHTSGAASLLFGLKCDRGQDRYLSSINATISRGGIRLASGEIVFFGESSQLRADDATTDLTAMAKWKLRWSDGAFLSARAALTSTGIADSNDIIQVGAAYETGVGNHFTSWRQRVVMTSYPGASSLVWARDLDAGGFNSMMELTDAGVLTIAGAGAIRKLTELSTTGLAAGQALTVKAHGDLILGIDADNNTAGSRLLLQAGGVTVASMSESAQVRLGDDAAASATLHLKGGIAAAGGAAIKLDAGTLLTAPEVGALEYDGTHMWFSRSQGGAKRRSVGLGFAALLGDGTNASFTVTHDLGSRRLIPYVARVSDNQGVGAKVTFPTLTTCVVTFSFVPTANSYWISLISAPELSGN